MEDIHGVDVSWLHRSNKDHHHRQQAPSSPGLTRDAPPKTSSHGGLPPQRPTPERKPQSTAPAVQEVSIPAPKPQATPQPIKTPPKRPSLISRASSDKNGTSPGSDSKSNLRRGSWISSISNKFSSQNSPAQTTHTQAQGSPAASNGAQGTTSSANGALNGIQQANGATHNAQDGYVPQAPKGSSFISNALRRLSSGTQVGTGGKVHPQGGLCPRKVLNVDQHRDRCLVPELDQNKLRRVAFCVDVEIAGGPRYKDDVDCDEKKKKRKENRLKEKGEGEALKHPESYAAEKNQSGAVTINGNGTNGVHEKEQVGTESSPNPEGTPYLEDDKKDTSKKKEKKKRSEAERKERKEKKRRKAEENGCIPLELTYDDDDSSIDTSSAPPENTTPTAPRPQGRPTTDPLRIYRRCCQLRETPILKRISDQLQNPKACSVVTPGVVTCLDLTGSRLQLADVVTLSDWLAVVPVKKLFLEDADLNDEKVRVILAGLLAAKVPAAPRRRATTEKPAQNGHHVEERSGYVLKVVLKNNPKIGAEGWRHISLFLYMCKSIQAIDLSMIPFPKPAPQLSRQSTNASDGQETVKPAPSKDTADIFSKAVSERLGGSRLEELALSECNLATSTIRKIIDSAVVSGIKRMGLAGNDINDEGFDHVLHYIRSGVCLGIDLGGNDVQRWIGKLAEALTPQCPLWALCLQDCGLTTKSLRTLLPPLAQLPNMLFLDLSHNRLCSDENSLCLLRKYLPLMKGLKRIHLADISLSPEQAIGLAEVLTECPQLAHINILQNPNISAVAVATDETTQEEAAALYASLMVAAKVSHTLIAVDVDQPGPESSEVVKALSKQVVAYCLRNMETFTDIPELKPETKPAPKEVDMPDVLWHLVGHSEGVKGNHDNDPPAPDDDYIVGGTGVVKALSYCLLQKATDIRRQSVNPSGATTPTGRSRVDENDAGKAKMMSKNLLDSARNIRSRLQPALVREARAGNDMGYRRLLFLDQTLQGMIQRFEDEYPETRVVTADTASTHSSNPSTSPPPSSVPTIATPGTPYFGGQDSDEDEPKAIRSRHNSDVSLAARALSLEEGRLHRLGHKVRTEIMNASRPTSSHGDDDRSGTAINPNHSGSLDMHNLPAHLVALKEKYLAYSGEDLRQMAEGVGWEKAFDEMVNNAEQLKQLQQENPAEFERFREAQIAALKNRRIDPNDAPMDTQEFERFQEASLKALRNMRVGDDFAVED